MISTKNKKQYETVKHTFDPVYDEKSEILILGSFPSVKSREQAFYYGHPQNRFWKVLAKITEQKIPKTIEQKKKLLLDHHIAVWDVIASCEIIGSSDSSIRNVKVNDIQTVLKNSRIQKIYANGAKAYQLFQKYVKDVEGYPAQQLPSTSPANAAWNFERLCEAWKEIFSSQNV